MTSPEQPTQTPLRVLLVDDHRLLLEGLTNLLEAHGIQVAGTACDGQEAISLAAELNPDVILMDIRMPVCDGLVATRCIKARQPETKIVILTTSADEADLFEAVRSGACGYLLKSMDAEELVECLRQSQQGIPPFSPGLASRLLVEFARLPAAAELKSGPAAAAEDQASLLTARQVEVLSLVSRGMTYKEAGQKLGLSPRTIKYHMAEILQVLHLENRAQVLTYAGRMGIRCDPPDG